MYFNYIYLNIVYYCVFICICIRLYVFFWMMIKFVSLIINDNRWLMVDVWISFCYMDINGVNFICWLCLINCRFDNLNIIWYYIREKNYFVYSCF